MPGLESLPQAINEGVGYEQFYPADVVFPGQTLSDVAALKLVIHAAQFSQTFVASKTLTQEWNMADDMFRDYVPQEKWPNKTNKSAIPMPIIMEAVESLLAQTFMAFFGDPQPFTMDPKGRTSQAAARAMAHLVCWAMEMSGFQEEIRKCLKSALLYGNLIGKYGWTTTKHIKKTYRASADQNSVLRDEEEHEIAHPCFEHCDLKRTMIDSHLNCPDIRRSGSVVFQRFLTVEDLDSLRKVYDNVPTRAQFKAIMLAGSEPTTNTAQTLQYITWRENQAERPENLSTDDPLKQPLEVLEYWDNTRKIAVLQRKIVMMNEEHDHQSNTFLSCAFVDVLNSFYGFGVAKLLSGEQWLQQGVVNKWVDSLSLKLAPMFKRKKGVGAQSQSIPVSPGKVINEDELEQLVIESISQEALEAISASEQRASRRVGSNFGPEMPTQAMRTAEGVQAFQSGVQAKLQYFIETFANQVFVPAIRAFIELIKDNMTPAEMEAILSERDMVALQALGGNTLQVYNGQYAVDVLTSTKLAARRQMLAMLTPVMQMLGQPAVIDSFNTQAKKFNWVSLFEEIGDVTGWPIDSFVDDMTDEDKQRLAMMNPSVVKAQADKEKMAQQHQNTLEEIDAKGDAQTGGAVVKSILKHHEVPPQALATQPPGGGNGVSA